MNHNLQSFLETFPGIYSGAVVGMSGGSNTASLPTFPGGERARESFSSRGQFCVTSPASGLNFWSSNMQSTSKSAFECFSAKYATPSVSGCPRVFCMGKSEWEKFIFSLWFMFILYIYIF